MHKTVSNCSSYAFRVLFFLSNQITEMCYVIHAYQYEIVTPDNSSHSVLNYD